MHLQIYKIAFECKNYADIWSISQQSEKWLAGTSVTQKCPWEETEAEKQQQHKAISDNG